ncbi:3-dehydroquinate synthase [Desulfosoma caldarium]|uniref:3-dehydroquinate synthase n=1 Tax=Desulfosoma caldarium TaxID=610254 RepID=A0A3N1UMA5_9BACT|nr:3-dehydroquinate synthase [Desulfosoma caldarium]ROQ89850.1 3-dehydroquinate synthase [Desulfosoma caldarium]
MPDNPTPLAGCDAPPLNPVATRPDGQGNALETKAGSIGTGQSPLDGFHVTFAPHGARSLAVWLQEHFPGRHPYIFVDQRVASLWGEILDGQGFGDAWIPWDAREDRKRLDTVEHLARAALSRGADRHSVFVAIGGGVTGDVVGFLASIFMRGVPVVQVPTTLLAQVDSCLGGKTGVDLPEGKNLLGTFHHPQAILVDAVFLKTLPAKEWQNGMAEVIKSALLDDGDLMETLESFAQETKGQGISYPLPHKMIEPIVFQSLSLKARHVATDEKDFGVRQFLNLGHTAGHGLEALSGYALPHGHAVALGMRVAVQMGILMGLTNPDLARRLDRILEAYQLPLKTLLAKDANALLRHIQHDKKKGTGGLTWIVPRDVGRMERRTDISDKIFRDALRVIQPNET